MNKNIKYLIAVGAVLAGTAFYNKVYIPKTTYEITKPTIGELSVSLSGIGVVGAKDIYSITAQTGGKILSLNTDVGQWVKKGDLLLSVDGVDLKEQLSVLNATLEKVYFDTKASEDELVNQKSQKVLIKRTYERYKKLHEQKYASQSEYDKTKADLDGINANINATIAKIGSSKMAIKIAQKNIDVIKAKIKRLKVYAPVDGYVIEKNAQVEQSVNSTTPIFKIVDATTLWVETKVDERVSRDIKVGQKATIHLRSQPNKTYDGVVVRIDAMSDAVTLERKIDVGFVNIPKPFYINEQAEVNINISTLKNVVKIPSKMVIQENGKLGVWTTENLTANFVYIHKVAQDANEVAVKDFDENTKLIIPNSHKKPLSNGMKIHL